MYRVEIMDTDYKVKKYRSSCIVPKDLFFNKENTLILNTENKKFLITNKHNETIWQE